MSCTLYWSFFTRLQKLFIVPAYSSRRVKWKELHPHHILAISVSSPQPNGHPLLSTPRAAATRPLQSRVERLKETERTITPARSIHCHRHQRSRITRSRHLLVACISLSSMPPPHCPPSHPPLTPEQCCHVIMLPFLPPTASSRPSPLLPFYGGGEGFERRSSRFLADFFFY